MTTGAISAQAKNAPRSIISTTALIRKYHDQKELSGMQKGELLELYIERIKVLVNSPLHCFGYKTRCYDGRLRYSGR